MFSIRETGFRIPVNRRIKIKQVDVDVVHQIQITNLDFICGFFGIFRKIPSIVK
jgi:hypothetical protein